MPSAVGHFIVGATLAMPFGAVPAIQLSLQQLELIAHSEWPIVVTCTAVAIVIQIKKKTENSIKKDEID